MSLTKSTVELHLYVRWLSGSPITRIASALRVNLSRILQNQLVYKLPVIGSIKHSVMAIRTSNQGHLKGLDTGTYCK
jgi:hypothetical protein